MKVHLQFSIATSGSMVQLESMQHASAGKNKSLSAKTCSMYTCIRETACFPELICGSASACMGPGIVARTRSEGSAHEGPSEGLGAPI